MALTIHCFCFCIFLSIFLVLLVWVSQVEAQTSAEMSMVDRYDQWMIQYGRVYNDSIEKEKRFLIFKNNVERIDSFNKAGDKPYQLGLNSFSDLDDEEFKATRTGYMNSTEQRPSSNTVFWYNSTAVEPTFVDWRLKGAVTPIKNQHSCGCCWAFASVAAMEGAIKLKTGQLISLSEQQLLDCDKTDNGCQGGWMYKAYQFIIQNGGLTTESNYPYYSKVKICNKQKAANRVAMITRYVDVPTSNEQQLLMAVKNQPVSVALAGSGFYFRSYKSGIFTGPCGTNLDHAVTLIGYGVDQKGIKYWLAKNSWGIEWGEEGYMRIQRDVVDKGGLCGLAVNPTYPIA